MDAATLDIAQKLAVAFITRPDIEGYRFQAYLDIANVVTLGYGSTTDDQGRPFKLGMTCSFAQAQSYLNYHLQKFVYPHLVEYELPPKIYAACASLIYNVGGLGPTIKNVLTLRKWDKLPDCFMQYIVVDGRVSQGLINRRKQEIAFFEQQ